MLSCDLYLTPKEGDVVYNQQCDTILKPKNFGLQTLLVTLEDKIFLERFHENLVNDSFIVVVISHWKNPFNDFDKFKFHNGLLYYDILLYILEDPAQFQVLQARHDTLIISHFGFNKTMELVSCDY